MEVMKRKHDWNIEKRERERGGNGGREGESEGGSRG